MPRTTIPRKRSYRCIRCAARKFRTPRDLALHILQKHGRIQLPTPPAEDARSVTLNSPFLDTDVEELDQLLAAAEHSISCSGGGAKRDSMRGIQKRVRSVSTSDCSRPTESGDASDERENDGEKSEGKPVDGESIGPKAHDVYIARCRSGRIPLVPLSTQPVTTLNFANSLF